MDGLGGIFGEIKGVSDGWRSDRAIGSCMAWCGHEGRRGIGGE